jgi:hypothetical protein
VTNFPAVQSDIGHRGISKKVSILGASFAFLLVSPYSIIIFASPAGYLAEFAGLAFLVILTLFYPIKGLSPLIRRRMM